MYLNEVIHISDLRTSQSSTNLLMEKGKNKPQRKENTKNENNTQKRVANKQWSCSCLHTFDMCGIDQLA